MAFSGVCNFVIQNLFGNESLRPEEIKTDILYITTCMTVIHRTSENLTTLTNHLPENHCQISQKSFKGLGPTCPAVLLYL